MLSGTGTILYTGGLVLAHLSGYSLYSPPVMANCNFFLALLTSCSCNSPHDIKKNKCAFILFFIFCNSFVEIMVSWVDVHVLTHQIIYIKNVKFLCINKNSNNNCKWLFFFKNLSDKNKIVWLISRKQFPQWMKKSFIITCEISSTGWNLNEDSTDCVDIPHLCVSWGW